MADPGNAPRIEGPTGVLKRGGLVRRVIVLCFGEHFVEAAINGVGRNLAVQEVCVVEQDTTPSATGRLPTRLRVGISASLVN